MPEAPYYESRYIRANHPDQPRALWLRETLLLPTAGDPVADVWVMVFDPEGEGNRALKQPYPIDAATYEYDNWTAVIGATSIDDRSAAGVVTGGNRSARWDLRITPGPEDAVRLLTDRAYKARIPTAQTTVRHPRAVIAEFARHSAAAGPDHAARLDELTEREREVLMLLTRGRSNSEIAADLVVSDATVKTHVAHVLMKLGVRDRVQAVIFAYESGLVTAGTA